MGEVIGIWFSRKDVAPESKRRILVFSPDHPKNDPMRLRLIDSDFWNISIDATHWTYVFEPDQKEDADG